MTTTNIYGKSFTGKPTKKERRLQQLERHYSTLAKLAANCGVINPDGKKLSLKLLKLEAQAHKLSTDYCNGVIQMEQWDNDTDMLLEDIQNLFNRNLKGLFINGDARGYAIKIKDEVVRSEYSEIGMHTDWGGYGILSPEINGN